MSKDSEHEIKPKSIPGRTMSHLSNAGWCWRPLVRSANICTRERSHSECVPVAINLDSIANFAGPVGSIRVPVERSTGVSKRLLKGLGTVPGTLRSIEGNSELYRERSLFR